MSSVSHPVRDRDPLRKPVTAIGSLLLLVILLVLVARVAKVGGAEEGVTSPVVASLSFVVKDEPDGAAVLVNRANGREILTIAPEGEQLFRSIRQVMLRERKRESAGEESLLLRRRADGTLELVDEATGFKLDVRSFGSLNGVFFSELLNRESTTP